MQNLNNVFLSGRAVSDAAVREFGNGGKVTVVRLASTRAFRSGDEWKERTTFIDCEAGGKVGERLAELATKGALLSVAGALESDEWEKDGEKRSKIKIRVNSFEQNVPLSKREPEVAAVSRPSASTRGQKVNFRKNNNGNQAELATGLPF